MKVSIIVPVFNAEKYLEECIESALNQTFKDIEIIAVNDGSNDGSLNILRRFSDKIKIISKSNGGAGSALNAGIKIASGEWIKRLDADDVLYPNCVEDLILEAERLENKTQTILYANYDHSDSDGRIIYKQIETNYNDIDKFNFNVMLLDHFIGLPTTSLIHKSSLEKFGLFTEVRTTAEDIEIWVRYCLKYNCRMHLVPKTVAKYRVHTNSVTRQNRRSQEIEAEQFRNSILENLDPTITQQYKIALRKYQKQKPISLKIFELLKKIIIRLPFGLNKKIYKHSGKSIAVRFLNYPQYDPQN